MSVLSRYEVVEEGNGVDAAVEVSWRRNSSIEKYFLAEKESSAPNYWYVIIDTAALSHFPPLYSLAWFTTAHALVGGLSSSASDDVPNTAR